MDDDILAKHDVKEVAAWYGRLATKVGKKDLNGSIPLATQFLQSYLANRDPKAVLNFVAPSYLTNYKKVKTTLTYHRSVFLTEEKARIKKGLVWAGIIPRLQDGRWNGSGKLAMKYESLVEIGGSPADVVRIQLRGNDQEQDLFTSLRGFQLKSEVTVAGAKNAQDQNLVHVKFSLWQARALDRYDWNYSEHLMVPNPDHRSVAKNAIRPDLNRIRVYHKNAKRLEDAKLAAPFNLEVGPWPVKDHQIINSAEVKADTTLK